MKIETKSRIFVFIASFIIWIILAGARDIQELVVGLVVALLTSLLAGQMLITTQKHKNPLRRLLYAVRYVITFLWEMIKANLHVAYLVAHPMVPIKPGIVKIQSSLSKDSALTVLTNSITLTPGTLTVDINEQTKEIYIHWIEVKSEDVKDNTRIIGDKFERLLTEVFE